MGQKNISERSSLPVWDPALAAEVAATVFLSYVQLPIAGGRRITFSELRGTNPRWREFPAAGLKSLSDVNRDAVSALLWVLGSIGLSEVKENGDVVVVEKESALS